jgi:carbamoyltransferase
LRAKVPAHAGLADRADLAASFQVALEEAVLFYAGLAQELTGARRLCMAGGVALNCLANQRVRDSGRFDDVFVFPAAADNGISFGAAYLGAHSLLGLPRGLGLSSASLGRSYAGAVSREALSLLPPSATVEALSGPALSERVAAALAAGRLVMWFQDGSEIGPRALGNRSIFADPRSVTTRDHINAAVKSREPFRPLAPIVLAEECGAWFDAESSPFMLFSPQAKPRTRRAAPAVVHVDGSARLQTVSREQNAQVHDLLRAFQSITGVPILLNTSFNIQGQPIVETPREAVATFLEAPVPLLYLDGYLVTKTTG